MLECHWKKTFGIECFGCGFQRSIIALIEGDLMTSLSLYPATIPILFTFIYTVAHLLFKYKNGARNIVILFSFSVVLMVGNFIYKLVTQ
jgi:hypothetical protein